MVGITNLFFAYPAQIPLFERLSLSLKPGSITGLLGKNGAGKSSLLRVIAGLLFPLSGEVKILAHEPRKRQPSFFARGISCA